MSAAAAKNSDDRDKPSDKSTVVLLFTIAADTTWRMFVPIIGATVIGVWADRFYGIRPWATVIAILIGVIIAVVLVRDQMKKAYKS